METAMEAAKEAKNKQRLDSGGGKLIKWQTGGVNSGRSKGRSQKFST
uniref:Uncharacterized protein n=1 Tax=Tetranychus urticae TaxID=32264 RepID=T1L315_TETUR